MDSPFPHAIMDNFFPRDVALALESEFPAYDDPDWVIYDSPLENKKTMNRWDRFPALTYGIIFKLCQMDGVDFGLHGGGWHIHTAGGNLNPHLDYIEHPKLHRQRMLNLIIYLSSDYRPEYGGKLGLWSGDNKKPHKLEKIIDPIFNRAVLFDTTQNSWHGMVTPFMGVARRSIALYLLGDEIEGRKRALFAPRVHQMNDEGIAAMIEKRAR